MKAMGTKVLPVFYDVDPNEVRRQTKGHFGKAFEKYQKRYKVEPDKVKRWKDALFHVGNLSGWHLQDGYESKVIQEIVQNIFTELNQLIPISEGLVGMDSHLNEILSYLDIGSPDVRIIGICGMGGIGKTTIAQVVFERVQAQFEGCSFLENIREEAEKQGAIHLQEQLLLNFLKCNVNVQTTKMGKDIIRRRLCTKRVLLILDDVDQEEQLEVLCNRTWFGPGSRIILTSRDEHLLSAFGVDKVYKVNPLTAAEALELFGMKAFKKDQLVGEDFLELSKEFLKYANGLPLAIKVLGSSVHGKNVKLWSSALDRLKSNPQKKIINVFKVSFDGLEETEKKIFLDIACFFKGWYIDQVTRILQGTDHCPDIDIEVLVNKSLVTLFGRKLLMHDLIQELGWEIVRQECREEPGKRSRLWLPNEIIRVLDRSKATSAIQSIYLQCPTGDDVDHSIDNAFSNMDRLRLLKISNLKCTENIRYLSNELQYLEWDECPLDSFPLDFQPDKLVELHMYLSRIKQLWRGKKGCSMLRLINLWGSQYLMSTPDFTEVPELEVLVLRNCSSLVEVHPSLGFLKKLRCLDMTNCKSIESLPPFTSLESLEKLWLSLCSGLKKFPEIEGNMKSLLELYVDGTSIEELPPSIERLTGLTMLDMTDCKNLLHLPNNIGCLTSLKSLYLTGCSKIDEIPENLNGMKCLEKLLIGRTSIRELSFIVGMKNLQSLSCRGCKCLVSESCKALASLSNLIELDLSYCNLMDGAFLNDFSSLISLTFLDLSGNCFVRLPESISQLSKLDTLHLRNCGQLQVLPKKLPLSLQNVFAEGCTSLTDYPNQIKVLNSWESGVTTVNSINSSELGVSQSYQMSVIPSKEGGSPELHVTYKHTVGKQVDQYLQAETNLLFSPVQMPSCSDFIGIYPRDEIPEWFSTISTRNPISISIRHQNLADDNEWKGFAACAIFSVKGHTALTLIEPDPDFLNYSCQVTLETDVMRLEPKVLEMELGRLGSSSHLLVIFFLSSWKFPQWGLNRSTVVRATFETTNPSMVVQKCGIRLVYEQDAGWHSRIFGEDDPICLNEVEDDALVLESGWLGQYLEWEKFIQSTSRTPVEIYFELPSRKYRNWDWSDPRAAYCAFKRVEISKLKWFMPFINQGNSAEIQLPLNVFDDDNWLGFVVYVQLSHDQYPNISHGSTTIDSEDVVLYFRLDSDVAWHGLFDLNMHLSFEIREPSVLDTTWFLYLPRTKVCSRMWRQCQLARITMWFSRPCLAVHSCVLRLLFKEDVEHLVETLTLAELHL